MRVRFLLAGTLCLLLRCNVRDEITVTSADGSLSLTYACDTSERMKTSQSEIRLIRREAGRVLRYEHEERRPERLASVNAAFEAGDDGALRLALVDYACKYGVPSRRPPRYPERGSPAPEFTLPVLDGSGIEMSVQADSGNVIVLSFWATWCIPCREEYPELVSIAQALADSGVVVYGILKDDSPQAARRWVSEYGGGIPILVDADGSVARKYLVNGIPHSVVIDRDQKIFHSAAGYFEGKMYPIVREAVKNSP